MLFVVLGTAQKTVCVGRILEKQSKIACSTEKSRKG
jgi:hypothetical protein